MLEKLHKAENAGAPRRIHYIFAGAGIRRSAELNCLMRFVRVLSGQIITTAAFDGVWEKRRIQEGDLLVCGHSGWNVVDGAATHDYEAFSVVYHLHHIRLVWNMMRDRIHLDANYFHTTSPAAGVSVSILEAIHDIMREIGDERNERIIPLVTALFLQLAHDVRKENHTPDGPPDPLAAQLMNYIQHHFQRPISCLEVADALQVNRSYASTVFRTRFGIPMKDYILKLRMEEAADLLLYPDMDIAEVGRECSFSDISYFIRVFRQFHGVTPGEYRKLRRNRQLEWPGANAAADRPKPEDPPGVTPPQS